MFGHVAQNYLHPQVCFSANRSKISYKVLQQIVLLENKMIQKCPKMNPSPTFQKTTLSIYQSELTDVLTLTSVYLISH